MTPLRLAMWSGPRNLSTALMYSFAARGDCAVWDEPFYAAYLARSGMDHPLRAAVIAAGEVDPEKVAGICAGPVPGGRALFYQKQMTLHMLEGFPRAFMRDCVNVFLIRHPARVVASYGQKREAVVFDDLGFAQQAALFEAEAEALGRPPLVLDSSDLRAAPEGMLRALCKAVGISFTAKMLRWAPGPKPYDGIWAPHWYGAVHASTGFDRAEGPLPDLPPEGAALAARALPYYESLAQHRLRAAV